MGMEGNGGVVGASWEGQVEGLGLAGGLGAGTGGGEMPGGGAGGSHSRRGRPHDVRYLTSQEKQIGGGQWEDRRRLLDSAGQLLEDKGELFRKGRELEKRANVIPVPEEVEWEKGMRRGMEERENGRAGEWTTTVFKDTWNPSVPPRKQGYKDDDTNDTQSRKQSNGHPVPSNNELSMNWKELMVNSSASKPNDADPTKQVQPSMGIKEAVIASLEGNPLELPKSHEPKPEDVRRLRRRISNRESARRARDRRKKEAENMVTRLERAELRCHKLEQVLTEYRILLDRSEEQRMILLREMERLREMAMVGGGDGRALPRGPPLQPPPSMGDQWGYMDDYRHL